MTTEHETEKSVRQVLADAHQLLAMASRWKQEINASRQDREQRDDLLMCLREVTDTLERSRGAPGTTPVPTFLFPDEWNKSSDARGDVWQCGVSNVGIRISLHEENDPRAWGITLIISGTPITVLGHDSEPDEAAHRAWGIVERMAESREACLRAGILE